MSELFKQLCQAGTKASSYSNVEFEVSFGKFSHNRRSGFRTFIPDNEEAEFEEIRQFFATQQNFTQIDEISQTISYGEIRQEVYLNLDPIYTTKKKLWRYDFPDHDFRITISTEIPSTKEDFELAAARSSTSLVRHRTRNSFVSLQADTLFDGLRIDCSRVIENSGKHENRKNEVEAEYIGDTKDFNAGRIEKAILKLLSIKQNSSFIISNGVKLNFISEHNNIFFYEMFETLLDELVAKTGQDDVPLSKFTNQVLEELRRRYSTQLKEFKSKPVNLLREHLETMFPSYVTYKTDGLRQLLGVNMGRLFGWNTYKGSLRLMQLEGLSEELNGLILDGELVKNTPSSRTHVISKTDCDFYAFDLLSVPTKLMKELGFKFYTSKEGFQQDNEEGTDPYLTKGFQKNEAGLYLTKGFLKHPFDGYTNVGGTGIRIAGKDPTTRKVISLMTEPYYKRYIILTMLKEKLPWLVIKQQRPVGNATELYAAHDELLPGLDDPDIAKITGFEVDGLIYTPAEAPYENEKTYKYKPASKLSIDFSVEILQGKIRLLYWSKGLVEFKGTNKYKFEPRMVESNSLSGFQSGQIVEFKWDSKKSMLVPMRVRLDKGRPNGKRAVVDCWNDFMNPIPLKTMLGNDLGMYRRFHNDYKKYVLQQVVLGGNYFESSSASSSVSLILDVGSGRGGDIGKWKHLPDNVNVIAVEPNVENYTELQRRLENETISINMGQKTISNEEGWSHVEVLTIPRRHQDFSIDLKYSRSSLLKVPELSDNLTSINNKLKKARQKSGFMYGFRRSMKLQDILTNIFRSDRTGNTFSVKFPQNSKGLGWYTPISQENIAEGWRRISDVKDEIVSKLVSIDMAELELKHHGNMEDMITDIISTYKVSNKDARQFIAAIQLQHYNELMRLKNSSLNKLDISKRVHPINAPFNETSLLMKKLERVTLRNGDTEKDFVPGTVDLVTVFFSFNYFFESDNYFKGFLNSVNAILRPGGRVVFLYLDGDRVIKRLKTKSSIQQPETDPLWSISVLSTGEDDKPLKGSSLRKLKQRFGVEILTNINDEKSMVHDVHEYLVFRDALDTGLATVGISPAKYHFDYSDMSFLTTNSGLPLDEVLTEDELALKSEIDAQDLAWRKRFRELRFNHGKPLTSDIGGPVVEIETTKTGLKRMKSITSEYNPLFETLQNDALPPAANVLSKLYRVAQYVKAREIYTLGKEAGVNDLIRRVEVLQTELTGREDDKISARIRAELDAHTKLLRNFYVLTDDEEYNRLYEQTKRARQAYQDAEALNDAVIMEEKRLRYIYSLYGKVYSDLKRVKVEEVNRMSGLNLTEKKYEELVKKLRDNLIRELKGLGEDEFYKRISTPLSSTSIVSQTKKKLYSSRMAMYKRLHDLMTGEKYSSATDLRVKLVSIERNSRELAEISDSFDKLIPKPTLPEENWVDVVKLLATKNFDEITKRRNVLVVKMDEAMQEYVVKLSENNERARGMKLQESIDRDTTEIEELIRPFVNSKLALSYRLVCTTMRLRKLPKGAELVKMYNELDNNISYIDTSLIVKRQTEEGTMFLDGRKYQQVKVQMKSIDVVGEEHLYDIEVLVPTSDSRNGEAVSSLDISSERKAKPRGLSMLTSSSNPDDILLVPSLLRRYSSSYFVKTKEVYEPLLSYMVPVASYFNDLNKVELDLMTITASSQEEVRRLKKLSKTINVEEEENENQALRDARLKYLYRSRSNIITRILSHRLDEIILQKKVTLTYEEMEAVQFSLSDLRRELNNPNTIIDLSDTLKDRFYSNLRNSDLQTKIENAGEPQTELIAIATRELNSVQTEIDYYTRKVPRTMLLDLLSASPDLFFQGKVTIDDVERGLLSTAIVVSTEITKPKPVEVEEEEVVMKTKVKTTKGVVAVKPKIRFALEPIEFGVKKTVKENSELIVEEPKKKCSVMLKPNEVCFVNEAMGIVRVGTSGDRFACLIHSILRATNQACTNAAVLRKQLAEKLTKDDLPEDLNLEKARKVLGDSSKFLDSDYFAFLTRIYGVNIIGVKKEGKDYLFVNSFSESPTSKQTVVTYNIVGAHFEVVGRWNEESKVVSMRFENDDPFISELKEKYARRAEQFSGEIEPPKVTYGETTSTYTASLLADVEKYSDKKIEAFIAKHGKKALEQAMYELKYWIAEEGTVKKKVQLLQVTVKDEDGPSLELATKLERLDTQKYVVVAKYPDGYKKLKFDDEEYSEYRKIKIRVSS